MSAGTVRVYLSTYQSEPALIVCPDDDIDDDAWVTFVLGLERGWPEWSTIGADISLPDERRMAFGFDTAAIEAADAVAGLARLAPDLEWRLEQGEPGEQLVIPPAGEIRIRWSEVRPGDADLIHRYAWEVRARPAIEEDAMHELAMALPDIALDAYVGPWNSDAPDGVEMLDEREPRRALREFAAGHVEIVDSLALSVLYEDLEPLGITARRATQESTVPANSTSDYIPLECCVTFHDAEGEVLRHEYFVVSGPIDADEWRRSLRGVLADLQLRQADGADR